jgi:hypothetical protein
MSINATLGTGVYGVAVFGAVTGPDPVVAATDDAVFGIAPLGVVALGVVVSAVSAPRSIADIDGDNSVAVGQTNIVIIATGLDAVPTVQTITLGGEALTILNWNNGNPIVSIPVDIQLKWGRTDLQLAVTDDTGTVTLNNVTLSPEAGWEYVDFNGTPPGPQTESGYELAQTDYGYSMVLGDQWIFKSESGLSYDAQTLPTLNPPATITSEYRVWNDSSASLSVKTTYTIAQKPIVSNGAFSRSA